MSELDQVRLNFNGDALLALNALLAIVMFGIALSLNVDDFRRIPTRLRAVTCGIFAQLFVLPALTFLLILIWRPQPSLALGMIVVAACPGGTISNFFSQLARGDVALSVTLSALSSCVCFLATPLNIALWGSLLPETRLLLRQVDVDLTRMLMTVGLVLVLPTLLGCFLATRRAAMAQRLRGPLRRFSMLAFMAFVIAAFVANWSLFIAFFGEIVGLVMTHNALALLAGFAVATLFGLSYAERRSVCIEVGIQNSALGLTLIFAFFGGLGGMALIAAWWGVWHLVSGGLLALVWARKAPLVPTNAAR